MRDILEEVKGFNSENFIDCSKTISSNVVEEAVRLSHNRYTNSAIQVGNSYVVVDTDGFIFFHYSDELEEQGYKISTLEAGYEDGITFDPTIGLKNIHDVIKFARLLTESAQCPEEEPNEQIEYAEGLYLAAILSYVLEVHSEDNLFVRAFDLIKLEITGRTGEEHTEIAELMKSLKHSDDKSPAVMLYEQYTDFFGELETLHKHVVSVSLNRLMDIVNDPELQISLGKDMVNYRGIAGDRRVIFIIGYHINWQLRFMASLIQQHILDSVINESLDVDNYTNKDTYKYKNIHWIDYKDTFDKVEGEE